jgi:hypothetical protein
LLREARTEVDFLEGIDSLVCTDPEAEWRFVVDNLNAHCDESLVFHVDEQCGIETNLGTKIASSNP